MHKCPKCGGQLERTRRHPLDRLLSLFVKVHRYQCQNYQCEWEGLLRAHHAK